MIAGTPLDADRAAALDRFMADVEALHASRSARDTIARLLEHALREPHSRSCWRSLYLAVQALIALASTPPSAQRADAYLRLNSFLSENTDLTTNTA